MVRTILTLLLCTIAAIFDLKTNTIPNELTFGFMVLGLAVSGSWHEVLYKILGLAFLFFFGMLRLMGMGDLKLWMAMCAVLGFFPGSFCIGIAALLLVFKAFFEDKNTSAKIVKITIGQLVLSRKLTVFEQKEYPFAPYILAGTVIYLILTHLKAVMF